MVKLNTKTIYLNVEQSAKPRSYGSLTQEDINSAFSGRQRHSNLVYKHSNVSVVIISGKNTGRLGVEPIDGPAVESLQVTNLERTLIDIVVRPAYAGGPSRVLNAYRAARDRISLDRLLVILKKLDYVYPYHQSIGFLMQKASYPEKIYTQLRTLGLNHDFYLAHGLQRPEYSKEWRLFYPHGLR